MENSNKRMNYSVNDKESHVYEFSDIVRSTYSNNLLLYGNGLNLRYSRHFKSDCLIAYCRDILSLGKIGHNNSDIHMTVDGLSRFISSKKNDFEAALFDIDVVSNCLTHLGFYLGIGSRTIQPEKLSTIKDFFFQSVARATDKSFGVVKHLDMEKLFADFRHVFTTNYNYAIGRSNVYDFFHTKNFMDKWAYFENRPNKQHRFPARRFYCLHGYLYDRISEHGEVLRLKNFDFNLYPEERKIGHLEKNFLAIKNGFCVAEGSSNQKKQCIESNEYLRFCYKTFSQFCQDEDRNLLFIVGFSFCDRDKHLINIINNARNTDVIIAYFGDLTDEYINSYYVINNSGNGSTCKFYKLGDTTGLPSDEGFFDK